MKNKLMLLILALLTVTNIDASLIQSGNQTKYVVGLLISTIVGVEYYKYAKQPLNFSEYIKKNLLEAKLYDEYINQAAEKPKSIFDHVKNYAFNAGQRIQSLGSTVKAKISDYPYASGTVAIVTLAGLGYLAYKGYFKNPFAKKHKNQL